MALYTGTATNPTVNPTNGNVDVTFTMTNGTRTVVRTIPAADWDDAKVKNVMLQIAEQLEAQDAAAAAITIGAIVFR